jgi:hypothetical protein
MEPARGLRAGVTSSGVTIVANQFWTQNTSGVLDAAEEGDSFGCVLSAWDFGNGAAADLAVGVPGEDVGIIRDAGAINVPYGGSTTAGPTTNRNQFWSQDSPGILEEAQEFERFGSTLYWVGAVRLGAMIPPEV